MKKLDLDENMMAQDTKTFFDVVPDERIQRRLHYFFGPYNGTYDLSQYMKYEGLEEENGQMEWKKFRKLILTAD